jgi:membrane protease YdiL (CAAX protease family)
VSPPAALGFAAACYFALQLIVSAFAALREGPLDIVTLGAAEALAYLGTTFLVLRIYERGASSRTALGLRPTLPGLALVGLGLGFSLKLPAESLAALTERFFPRSDSELLARAALYRADDLVKVVGLTLVVCLVAPLVEELLFRGALYGRLAKASAPGAAVVTGFAFVVMHADVRHWPSLIVVASVLGYLRVASGSVLPCVCLHVAFNAAGVLALVSGVASPIRPLDVPLIWIFATWLIAGVLVLALVRLADDPGAAQARAEDRG